MSTNIKLSKAQISNIIQSVESFCSWLANLCQKHLAITLARDNLHRSVSSLALNAMN